MNTADYERLIRSWQGGDVSAGPDLFREAHRRGDLQWAAETCVEAMDSGNKHALQYFCEWAHSTSSMEALEYALGFSWTQAPEKQVVAAKYILRQQRTEDFRHNRVDARRDIFEVIPGTRQLRDYKRRARLRWCYEVGRAFNIPELGIEALYLRMYSAPTAYRLIRAHLIGEYQHNVSRRARSRPSSYSSSLAAALAVSVSLLPGEATGFLCEYALCLEVPIASTMDVEDYRRRPQWLSWVELRLRGTGFEENNGGYQLDPRIFSLPRLARPYDHDPFPDVLAEPLR